jgi:hypothetical protein
MPAQLPDSAVPIVNRLRFLATAAKRLRETQARERGVFSDHVIAQPRQGDAEAGRGGVARVDIKVVVLGNLGAYHPFDDLVIVEPGEQPR